MYAFVKFFYVFSDCFVHIILICNPLEANFSPYICMCLITKERAKKPDQRNTLAGTHRTFVLSVN